MKQIFLVGALSLLSYSAVGAETKSSTSTLFVSPPIGYINDKRLAMTLPAGWKIVRRDEAAMWNTREYDIELESADHKQSLVFVLLWRSFSGARNRGEYAGKRFHTQSGIWGRAHQEEKRWYFAVPVEQKKQVDSGDIVMVLAVDADKGKAKGYHSTVMALYRSVRFLPAPKRTHNHLLHQRVKDYVEGRLPS